jgi:hypothetical protein
MCHIGSYEKSPIEFLVLDLVWVSVPDRKFRIDDECVRARVPTSFRPHTLNSGQIVVGHCCTRETLRELIAIMDFILHGESVFSVEVMSFGCGGQVTSNVSEKSGHVVSEVGIRLPRPG